MAAGRALESFDENEWVIVILLIQLLVCVILKLKILELIMFKVDDGLLWIQKNSSYVGYPCDQMV